MNPERLFETYLREYFAAHRESIARRGGLEEVLPELYARWSNRALPELGGKTPREYIDGMTDPADLLAVIEDSVSRGGEPSPMALDRLAALPSAERALLDLLENGENENMRITAAELLSRTDKLPAQTGTELVFDPSTPERLRETLVDLLKGTDGVTEILLDRIGSVEGENRKILAEMSVASGRTDDRIFALLLELLGERENLPFAAQLLAAYGDPRAIEPLSALAETCDYADYIELRNAVEELGGELTLRLNWDGDKTYKKIKGED